MFDRVLLLKLTLCILSDSLMHTLAICEDLDEMLHNAPFHLGPHYLIAKTKTIFLFSFSIYCLTLACEYHRQVYFEHSGLQDESQQVTISKLPYGSLTCTGVTFPAQGTSS